MIPAGGALVSVMNAIGDAPPELGILHMDADNAGTRVAGRSRKEP